MTGRADPAGPGPGPVPGRPSGWRLGVGADEPWRVRAVGDPYPAIGIGGARSAAHAPGTALTYADGGSLSKPGAGLPDPPDPLGLRRAHIGVTIVTRGSHRRYHEEITSRI